MIYFVSDTHLGGGKPEEARRVEDAFCRWIDQVAPTASAIYLMGDIFDFWWEYRRVVPKGFTRLFGRLADLTRRGVEVHMFIGNHDMWCGEYLHQECGVVMHMRPEVISIGGRTLHLAHGDNMNIKGQPLLRLMNAGFRSSLLRWLFSRFVHPDLAVKFGLWWSGRSRQSHSKCDASPESLGFLIDYASKHHTLHKDVEAYIFGHMHIPYDYHSGDLRVLFMSDWSGDVATYVAMDERGDLHLKTFQIR